MRRLIGGNLLLLSMDFSEVIVKRRSVRRYKPDPVSDELIDKVLEAARIAPSAGNRQPWHFIVVRDAEKKKALEINDWAAEAPVVIVGCTDTSQSPTWCVVGAAIAFEHLVLAATAYGLGTCWMGKLDNEVIKRVMNIPDGITVVAVTPLGYSAEEHGPRPRKTLAEIVHHEKF